jgi:CRISPR/Cas system CSM-associated protein Csm3 (group 7 of RAMP superfamily)
MLMQAANELNITLKLFADSPVLIKDGRFGDEQRELWSSKGSDERKRMPNAIPISRATVDQIYKAVISPTPQAAVEQLPGFFIPGTSLRGAWRGHLERIFRALDPPTRARVCDPLDDQTEPAESDYLSCSKALTNRRDSTDRIRQAAQKRASDNHSPYDGPPPFIPYSHSCPICRLFGNTLQGSRFSISDAELIAKPKEGAIVAREHVRIDRRKGSVTGAPLKFYALYGTTFRLDLRLRNFELIQLRLIGQLLNDISLGGVLIGSGKSKGYGKVKAAFESIRLSYFGLQPPQRLAGVAEHPNPEIAAWFQTRYGLTPVNVEIPLPGTPTPEEEQPWRFTRVLTPEQFQTAWRAIPFDWASIPPLAARKLEAAL